MNTPIKLVRGGELVIQVSDDNGTTYKHNALINATRGISLSSEKETDEIIDLDDQLAPAFSTHFHKSVSFTIEGQGRAHEGAIKYWMDWMISGDAKPVKVIAADATITGKIVLDKMDVSGDRTAAAEFSCSLMSDGPFTVTETPAS